MYVQTTITVFNKRLGDDRREVYFPAVISGASYHENKGTRSASSGTSAGARSESLSYKLRIPINAEVQDGRTYAPEKAFKAMTAEEAREHWTLQKGDIILARETALADPVDETALKQLAAAELLDVITVTEYADNTLRGTAAVKHWRIGGE